MPNRAVNQISEYVGVFFWGAGTALAEFDQQRAMAVALALTGIIVMLGRAARSEYHEWSAIRRTEREADIKLDMLRAQQLSQTRHDQMMDEVKRLRDQIIDIASKGCANVNCPSRKAVDLKPFNGEDSQNG